MTSADIYGPNTAQVEQFLQAVRDATPEQWAAARDATGDVHWVGATPPAREAAGEAAEADGRGEAWDAAWYATMRTAAAGDVSWDAAWSAEAIVTCDLITPEEFALLTEPMRVAGILPEDLR